MLKKKYPNSGIVCRLMVNIARRLGNKDIKEDPKVLMAITTEIAICSPRIYQQALAIISVLITQLDSTEEKEQYVKLVFEKLMRLPNIGNIQVWMQRLTYKEDKAKGSNAYNEPLCKLVWGESIELWDMSWVSPKLLKNFPIDKICDKTKLMSLAPSITASEFDLFEY